MKTITETAFTQYVYLIRDRESQQIYGVRFSSTTGCYWTVSVNEIGVDCTRRNPSEARAHKYAIAAINRTMK